MDFKEWASETITEGDSRKLMEGRGPNEESPVVATAFRIKRKAESDPAEEIEESGDENEESSDESEEMDYDMEERSYVEEVNAYFESKWITPEWDVDSFDNLKFDEEKEAKVTEYIDEKDVQDWLRFRRQQIENKGFIVDRELWPMYKYSKHSVIEDLEMSAGLGQTYRDYFKEMACLCLQRFNQEEKEKDENFINVEFVKVVGGVYKGSDCAKSYITFMAKEKPGGSDVEYQAKVWSDLVKDSIYPEEHPILCRRAPPPKTSNQN